MGYRREYQVEARGELAVRGAIVDIYPSTADHPVRIDLWGDEVDRLSAVLGRGSALDPRRRRWSGSSPSASCSRPRRCEPAPRRSQADAALGRRAVGASRRRAGVRRHGVVAAVAHAQGAAPAPTSCPTRRWSCSSSRAGCATGPRSSSTRRRRWPPRWRRPGARPVRLRPACRCRSTGCSPTPAPARPCSRCPKAPTPRTSPATNFDPSSATPTTSPGASTSSPRRVPGRHRRRGHGSADRIQQLLADEGRSTPVTPIDESARRSARRRRARGGRAPRPRRRVAGPPAGARRRSRPHRPPPRAPPAARRPPRRRLLRRLANRATSSCTASTASAVLRHGDARDVRHHPRLAPPRVQGRRQALRRHRGQSASSAGTRGGETPKLLQDGRRRLGAHEARVAGRDVREIAQRARRPLPAPAGEPRPHVPPRRAVRRTRSRSRFRSRRPPTSARRSRT